MISVTGNALINNGSEVLILRFQDGCSTATSANIVRRIRTTEENIGS